MLKVNLPVKIHNRFEVEVRDVTTGEIVKKGFAENILLDQAFKSTTLLGNGKLISEISYGSGVGTLSPARTTLFNHLGYKTGEEVEKVYNTPPLASYRTARITITPAEHIGDTFTEVGISRTTTLVSHALLKDSEGNPLTLGPKTSTQEITIYATVYVQFDLVDGMKLIGGNMLENVLFNNFVASVLDVTWTTNHKIYVSTDKTETTEIEYSATAPASVDMFFNVIDETAKTISTPISKFLTSQGNVKIWSLYARKNTNVRNTFRVLMPNSMFPGWNFINKSIGVGDGSTTTFALPWDEARLDKTKKVYADGVEVTTGVTWTEGSVAIVPAPATAAVITGDWWVDYIPKDSNHELWVQFVITVGEGAPV